MKLMECKEFRLKTSAEIPSDTWRVCFMAGPGWTQSLKCYSHLHMGTAVLHATAQKLFTWLTLAAVGSHGHASFNLCTE